MSKNILLISPSVLKERTALHDNVDEKLIYPEIKAAQDMYLLPLLGTALFNRLLTAVSNGSLSGAYKKLVDEYLIDCLVNYVLSEMPENINFQFTNKGVTTKTGDNTQQPSLSDMYSLVAKYKSRAEHYRQRAEKYLRQNADALFPEYLNPGDGCDAVRPDTESFTVPIYLESPDRCKRPFRDRYQ